MGFHRASHYQFWTWIVVAVFVAVEVASASDEGWPGWRGLSREGRALSPSAPTNWSTTHNIRWKTSIPGSGYSSPVVSNDSVYVTTAYATQESGILRQTLGYVVVFLSLSITLAAIRFIVHSCRPCNDIREYTARFVSATTFTFMLAIFIFLIHFGEHLCDFQRCNIRGWIGSSVLSSLCLLLAAHRLNNRKARNILGGAAFLFGGFVLLCFPSKDHVFRSGILGLTTIVALIPGVFPIVIGAFLLVKRFPALPNSRPDPGRLPERKRWHPSMRLHGFIWTFAIVALATAYLVFQLITADSTPDIGDARYQSILGRWALPLSGSFFGFCALIRVLRRTTLTRTPRLVYFIFVASTVLLALAVGVTLLETLAENSSYLTYHIGDPQLKPQTGWLIFAIFVALCASFIAVSLVKTKVSSPHETLRIPILFRSGTLLLAFITFVHTNYLLPSEVFVRAIVCLDRANGRITWICEGLPGNIGRLDKRNSPATPTPIVYGQYVYAYFGTSGLMCCDLKGNLHWTKKTLPYESVYGVGTSPTISDDILIVVSDMPQGSSHIWALHCQTGNLRWTQEWPAFGNVSGSSRTPLIRFINGEKVVLVWGPNCLRAYCLFSGREAWVYSFEPRGQDLVACMVSDQACIYLSDSSGTMALDQDKLGTSTDPVLWKTNKRGANCSSPVLANDSLFFVTDIGIAHCLDSHTGKIRWRERLNGKYYASLIASGNRVYFTNTAGATTVLANESECRKLAENDFAEETYASAAPVDNQLFVRTSENLYCIQAP